jgi:NAD-dependent DNA ligase
MSIKTRLGNVVEVVNQNKKIFSENEFYYAVMVKLDGQVVNLMLTEKEIIRALSRADKNIEDNLDQSVISKLID